MTGTGVIESGALLERAAASQRSGELHAALQCYDRALDADPANAGAWCERGNVLADLGRGDQALASYDRAIALAPELPDPHDFRGIMLAQAGRLPEALESLDRALALNPDNPNALNNRANVLKSLDRVEEALEAQDRVIAMLPGFAPGHNNRGNILIALGRFEDAVASFDRALALDPAQVQSHLNRAKALVMLMRREQAVESFRRALALDSEQPEAILDLADLLVALGQAEEAVRCYEYAISLDPENAEAFLSLGDALLQLCRPERAAACYERALSLDPERAEVASHLGIAMMQLRRPADAMACFDRAIALDPEDPQTWQRRGQLFMDLGRVEDAHASHARALEVAPGFPYQAGQCLQMALRLSRWDEIDRLRMLVTQSVVEGDQLVAPFDLATAIDDPALQKRCAELFVAHRGLAPAIPIVRRPARDGRIRLGYVSADFREHATMRLFLETLEAHDRARFELIAFSSGPDRQDAWQRRVVAAVDRFIDCRDKSDRELVLLSRELEVDIAIDLKGFTDGNRTLAFAQRLAPVQVSYLGYPGTVGMAAMDYILADDMLVPRGAEAHYSEKIVYLPDCYQANARVGASVGAADRAGAGLPAGAMVYCCFNQNYKITPEMFAVWMRILRAVPGSMLWLWANEESARRNLRRAASEAGVEADRLIFASRLPPDAHLDRLRLADLFLDTLPCNAHTTASDALRMGLPVLTCPGRAFASRVAASLLRAMDLPELIAADLDAYEAIAIALGRDGERRAELRARVERNREASTLFDPDAMARKLEDAYRAIHARHAEGLPPDHIRL